MAASGPAAIGANPGERSLARGTAGPASAASALLRESPDDGRSAGGGLACESETDCPPHAEGGDSGPGPLSTTIYDAIPAWVSCGAQSSRSARQNLCPQPGLGRGHYLCGHGRRVGVCRLGHGSVFAKIGGLGIGILCRRAVNLGRLAHGLGPTAPRFHAGASFGSRRAIGGDRISRGVGASRNHALDESEGQLL